MKEEKKEVINQLIKKLEEIRDTDEIENINIIPYEEVERFEMINGKTYVFLQTTISIRHNGLYKKGTISDDFTYKLIN